MSTKKLMITMLAIAFMAVTACGGGDNAGDMESGSSASTETTKEETPAADGKGIGPVKNVDIPEEIDEQMAMQGQEVFEAKCTACHEFAERYVGPALRGVSQARKPEWIMNMILNPEVMVKEDETAQELLAEYIAPMANQGITEEEARAILEYFRQIDNK
jgi:mono/diheme cytochrome c family protein